MPVRRTTLKWTHWTTAPLFVGFLLVTPDVDPPFGEAAFLLGLNSDPPLKTGGVLPIDRQSICRGGTL